VQDVPALEARSEDSGDTGEDGHEMSTDDELRAVGYLPVPRPGERCELCNRRVNKKRTEESPEVRRLAISLPADRMEPVEEGFDALQQVVGADPYSYPRGTLLEALLVLGGQHREELARYFNGAD
jgi:hypothetical protein